MYGHLSPIFQTIQSSPVKHAKEEKKNASAMFLAQSAWAVEYTDCTSAEG